ncbi:hypothetical protein [Nonomuraea basaltis]|nr:hypothetical protein [Nonomuraea basaltis]
MRSSTALIAADEAVGKDIISSKADDLTGDDKEHVEVSDRRGYGVR